MKSLGGKTILLTRAADDNRRWRDAVRARGGLALELPCIRTEPLQDRGTVARLHAELRRSEWLAVTSRRGVAALAALHPDPVPPSLRVAAVAEATGHECRERLGRCDLIPARRTARGLARALLETLATNGNDGESEGRRHGPIRVLTASALVAEPHLEEVLEPAGIVVVRVPVYRTVAAAPVEPKRDLADLGLDAILLASPSAVRGLVNQARIPSGIRIVSIGPATTEAARALGVEITAEARTPALHALLESL